MPDDLQRVLDTRAIELAAGANAVLTQHLTECRDRYMAVAKGIEGLQSMIWKVAGGTVLLLLTIIGFLVKAQFFGLPGAHL